MVNHVGGWLEEGALFQLYTKMEKPQGWQQSLKDNKAKSHYLEKGKDSEARQSIQNLNHVMLMWKTVAYLQFGFSNTKPFFKLQEKK